VSLARTESGGVRKELGLCLPQSVGNSGWCHVPRRVCDLSLQGLPEPYLLQWQVPGGRHMQEHGAGRPRDRCALASSSSSSSSSTHGWGKMFATRFQHDGMATLKRAFGSASSSRVQGCLAHATAAVTVTNDAKSLLCADWNCGGGVCQPCGGRMKCQAARDCRSGVCTGGLCVPPSTCSNGRLDPGEGGGCPFVGCRASAHPTTGLRILGGHRASASWAREP
jgi:hypothetical protein